VALLLVGAAAQCTTTVPVNGYVDCSATPMFDILFGVNANSYTWQATYLSNLQKFYKQLNQPDQASVTALLSGPPALTFFAPQNSAWTDTVQGTGPIATLLSSFPGVGLLSYHTLPSTLSIIALPDLTLRGYSQTTYLTDFVSTSVGSNQATTNDPNVVNNQVVNIQVVGLPATTRAFKVWGFTDFSSSQTNTVALSQSLIVLCAEGYIYGVRNILIPPRKMLFSFRTPGVYITELKRKSLAGTGCSAATPTAACTALGSPDDANLAQSMSFFIPPDSMFTSVTVLTGGATKSYIILTEAQKTFVLLYHMVSTPGVAPLYSTDYFAAPTTVTSSCNAAQYIVQNDASTKTLQVTDLANVLLARITKVDVLLQNGVIFTLDRILIAPAACIGF